MKSLLYKIGKSNLSKYLLKLTSPLLRLDLNGNTNPKNITKQSFEICLTIDTEPGYINKNCSREWITEGRDSHIGYSYGIKHLLGLAEKHHIKLTFLICTKFLIYPQQKEIIDLLKKAYKQGHEIGLHHHPRRNPFIGGRYTNSSLYEIDEIQVNLRKEKELIKKCLGKDIANNLKSFRWGNWALYENKAKALGKEGFEIDSSAVPGIKGHERDDRTYDWKDETRRFPWRLNNSKVLELPIATFSLFGKVFRADPFLNSQLLINGFKKYYNNKFIRSKPFKFVVMTHSNEMVNDDGSPSYVLENLEKFIIFTKPYFIYYNTLNSK